MGYSNTASALNIDSSLEVMGAANIVGAVAITGLLTATGGVAGASNGVVTGGINVISTTSINANITLAKSFELIRYNNFNNIGIINVTPTANCIVGIFIDQCNQLGAINVQGAGIKWNGPAGINWWSTNANGAYGVFVFTTATQGYQVAMSNFANIAGVSGSRSW